MNGSMMKTKLNNATQRVATQLIYALLVLCICSVGATAIGQEKGTGNHERVVGAWTWTTQQSDGGLFTSVMDLRLVDAGSLVGAIRNPKGESIPFEAVTMKGSQIQVMLDYQILGQTFKASYTGNVSNNDIEGEVVIRFQDRTLQRAWKAKRLQEFPLAGEWDWKLSTPDGNELKAKLILHHDSKGVSGRLESDQFNMPLRDVSFNAGQLKFVTQREEDGGTFYSSGKWHGHLLSGDVSSPSIGEELKLPWEARKR